VEDADSREIEPDHLKGVHDANDRRHEPECGRREQAERWEQGRQGTPLSDHDEDKGCHPSYGEELDPQAGQRLDRNLTLADVADALIVHSVLCEEVFLDAKHLDVLDSVEALLKVEKAETVVM